MLFRKSDGYVGILILLAIAVGVIFTGEIFSFMVGEKTPGQYDSSVKYVPTPLPNIPASNNMQMIVQTYGKVQTSLPPGGDYCNQNFLAQYFGLAEAKNAACICRNESGGNPFSVNHACMSDCKGDPLCQPNGGHKSREYSVGLFQANILVHESYNGTDCPSGFSNVTSYYSPPPYYCDLGNRADFDSCAGKIPNQGMEDPITNIKWSVDLFRHYGWGQWGTHTICGI